MVILKSPDSLPHLVQYLKVLFNNNYYINTSHTQNVIDISDLSIFNKLISTINYHVFNIVRSQEGKK